MSSPRLDPKVSNIYLPVVWVIYRDVFLVCINVVELMYTCRRFDIYDMVLWNDRGYILKNWIGNELCDRAVRHFLQLIFYWGEWNLVGKKINKRTNCEGVKCSE